LRRQPYSAFIDQVHHQQQLSPSASARQSASKARKTAAEEATAFGPVGDSLDDYE
jgi:hypothetical protein